MHEYSAFIPHWLIESYNSPGMLATAVDVTTNMRTPKGIALFAVFLLFIERAAHFLVVAIV